MRSRKGLPQNILGIQVLKIGESPGKDMGYNLLLWGQRRVARQPTWQGSEFPTGLQYHGTDIPNVGFLRLMIRILRGEMLARQVTLTNHYSLILVVCHDRFIGSLPHLGGQRTGNRLGRQLCGGQGRTTHT